MKVFECRDTDGGNKTFIISKDIINAIKIFEEKYHYQPEWVYNMSIDSLVLIEEK